MISPANQLGPICTTTKFGNQHWSNTGHVESIFHVLSTYRSSQKNTSSLPSPCNLPMSSNYELTSLLLPACRGGRVTGQLSQMVHCHSTYDSLHNLFMPVYKSPIAFTTVHITCVAIMPVYKSPIALTTVHITSVAIIPVYKSPVALMTIHITCVASKSYSTYTCSLKSTHIINHF